MITAHVTGDVAAVRLLTEQQPNRLLFERVWIRRSWRFREPLEVIATMPYLGCP
jgi:hypothetical protein